MAAVVTLRLDSSGDVCARAVDLAGLRVCSEWTECSQDFFTECPLDEPQCFGRNDTVYVIQGALSVFRLCRVSKELKEIAPVAIGNVPVQNADHIQCDEEEKIEKVTLVDTQAEGAMLYFLATGPVSMFRAEASYCIPKDCAPRDYYSLASVFVEESFLEIESFIAGDDASALLSALQYAPTTPVGPLDFRRYRAVACPEAHALLRSDGLRAALAAATGLRLGGIASAEVRVLANGDYQILHGSYASMAAPSGLDIILSLCDAETDRAFDDSGLSDDDSPDTVSKNANGTLDPSLDEASERKAFEWHADCASVVYLVPPEGSDSDSDDCSQEPASSDEDSYKAKRAHTDGASEVALAVRPRNGKLAVAYRAPDGPALQVYVGHIASPVPVAIYQLLATFTVLSV